MSEPRTKAGRHWVATARALTEPPDLLNLVATVEAIVAQVEAEGERGVAIRALDAVLGMMDTANKDDTWPDMIDSAKFVIHEDGLDVLERRIADDAEDWACVDCGIPLEPGAPPICEECADD